MERETCLYTSMLAAFEQLPKYTEESEKDLTELYDSTAYAGKMDLQQDAYFF